MRPAASPSVWLLGQGTHRPHYGFNLRAEDTHYVIHTKPKTSCQGCGQLRDRCACGGQRGRGNEGGGAEKGEKQRGGKAVDWGPGRRRKGKNRAASVGMRGHQP